MINAQNITELRDELNRIESKNAESIAAGGQPVGEEIDLSSLPTFGGEEPGNTEEIFSWDATHLLVQTGDGGMSPGNGWALVERAEWAS